MERPLLVWPRPAQAQKRSKAGGGAPAITCPSTTRQAERLSPRFDAIRQEFESQRIRLAATAAGALPELVLVLEVVGGLERFRSAIAAIGELRWLTEQLGDDLLPDEDFYGRKPDASLPSRLYFIAATPRGLEEILSMWRRHHAGEPPSHGQVVWRDLFRHLRDIRAWGRKDRLVDTGALEDWLAAINAGAAAVDAEVDLWFRGDPRSTAEAERRTLEALRDAEAEVLDGPLLVEGAGVHMVLARIPARAVRRMADDPDYVLGQLVDIRAYRVASEAVATVRAPVGGMEAPAAPAPAGTPVVAVLDGLPVKNHVALVGRVHVEDPDAWSATIDVGHRNHGTAVCSTVIWADLNAPGEPPRRPIYVRPVLRPDGRPQHEQDERGPRDRLFLDLVHGAVARLYEGDDPVAPEVAVINLSIGERNRIFDGLEIGPLARLLDFLAWHYQILFIISVGNCSWRQEEFQDIGRAELERAEVRHPALLRRLRDQAAARMLLSPSESINALSVGALDADDGGPSLPRPYLAVWGHECAPAPAAYSRIGPGLRRAPKPDVVMPGGRQPVEILYRSPTASSLRPYLGVAARPNAPGIRVAAPGQGNIEPTRGQRCECGTSFAAAMLTHVAARVSDALDDLLAGHPDLFNRAPRAVWLKTLLVHGSSRRDLDEWISPLLEGPTAEQWRLRNRLLDRYAGHGQVSLERALHCTAQRVTVLAGGALAGDQAHDYRFPLPDALRGVPASFRRRLVVTLTWLSPPWPSSARYRGAVLTLDAIDTPGLSFKGTERGDARHIGAGTVVHLVKHGRGLAKYVQGEEIAIRVNCRGDAAQPLDQSIPYAVAVTLEVDASVGVDIYQDVEARLRVAPRVQVPIST